MKQTAAERKAKERQRKREMGLVKWECWCNPDHREVMRAFLECLQSGYAGTLKVNSIEIEIKTPVDG